jgi:hypothetical protein
MNPSTAVGMLHTQDISEVIKIQDINKRLKYAGKYGSQYGWNKK